MKKNTKNCSHGLHGLCCCNCVNLVEITNHPMNRTIGNGSIMTNLGFACKARYGDEPKNEVQKMNFSERIHGMCELHIKNEVKKDKK